MTNIRMENLESTLQQPMAIIKNVLIRERRLQCFLSLLLYTINLVSLDTLFHHLSTYALSYVESWELNSLKARRKRLTNEETVVWGWSGERYKDSGSSAAIGR